MKLLVDETGLNGKPINPYYCIGNIEYNNFYRKYPSRPLTIPQKPNSVIEVEDETVWQYFSLQLQQILDGNFLTQIRK